MMELNGVQKPRYVCKLTIAELVAIHNAAKFGVVDQINDRILVEPESATDVTLYFDDGKGRFLAWDMTRDKLYQEAAFVLKQIGYWK